MTEPSPIWPWLTGVLLASAGISLLLLSAAAWQWIRREWNIRRTVKRWRSWSDLDG